MKQVNNIVSKTNDLNYKLKISYEEALKDSEIAIIKEYLDNLNYEEIRELRFYCSNIEKEIENIKQRKLSKKKDN